MEVSLINDSGSIMYAGQLYNAVRKEALLPMAWDDMELMICVQRPSRFFVGDAPSGLADHLKRYMLSTGLSAAMHAKNRRSNVKVTSVKGPRDFSILCAVGQIFVDRYCGNDQGVKWSMDMIQSIIHAKFRRDVERQYVREGDSAEKNSTPRRDRKFSKLVEKLRHRYDSVTTVKILVDLAEGLHYETVELNLGYLRIHSLCWKLLRSVNEACKPQLLDIYGSGYLEEEHQLPLIVGYIFAAACDSPKTPGLLKSRREGVRASRRLLETAARIICQILESEDTAVGIKTMEKLLGFKVLYSEKDEPPIIGGRIHT